MHHHYNDIRDRISEPVNWWDEYAVPRYCTFTPEDTADIYADECALVDIACQNCGTHFNVAFSRSKSFAAFRGDTQTLADRIRQGSLHYGDPPNMGCCASGPTMNCDDFRVLEYWNRDKEAHLEWVRDERLEIPLPDHPDYQESETNTGRVTS